MKKSYLLVLILLTALFAGCTDQKAVEQKARDDAAAKARAEAARKEMETVPKVFRPQYHNKKLDPDSKSTAPTAPAEPAKKP